MTSELDFVAALDAEPGNHWLRQVYADWLEDHGDERAAGMRALAVLGKEPDGFGEIWGGEEGEEGWCWWSMKSRLETQYKLPQKWLPAIKCDPQNVFRSEGVVMSKDFSSRAAAEDAAAIAWLKLTDAERAKIMAGVKV